MFLKHWGKTPTMARHVSPLMKRQPLNYHQKHEGVVFFLPPYDTRNNPKSFQLYRPTCKTYNILKSIYSSTERILTDSLLILYFLVKNIYEIRYMRTLVNLSVIRRRWRQGLCEQYFPFLFYYFWEISFTSNKKVRQLLLYLFLFHLFHYSTN
jgi:hypothetical protein